MYVCHRSNVVHVLLYTLLCKEYLFVLVEIESIHSFSTSDIITHYTHAKYNITNSNNFSNTTASLWLQHTLYCHMMVYCLSIVTAKLVRVSVFVLALYANPEMGCPFKVALVGGPSTPTTTTLLRTGSLAAVA